MNDREQLMILSYVDGELSGSQLRAAEQYIAASTEAKALVAELRMSAEVIRSNEPIAALPMSKEFYWSQIAAKIHGAKPEPMPSFWSRFAQPAFWLRYISPVAATAAVAIVAVVGFQRNATEGEEDIASAPETSSVVFRSDAEKMTVIWLQTDDNSDFTDPDADSKL